MAKLTYLGTGRFEDPDSRTSWESGESQRVSKEVADRLLNEWPGLFTDDDNVAPKEVEAVSPLDEEEDEEEGGE